MSATLLVGAVLAAFLGSALLALSQKRHWLAVTGALLRTNWPMRSLGWVMISTSLVLAVLRDGPSFAILFWPMLVGLGAMVTSAILTWMPSALKPVMKWCVQTR